MSCEIFQRSQLTDTLRNNAFTVPTISMSVTPSIGGTQSAFPLGVEKYGFEISFSLFVVSGVLFQHFLVTSLCSHLTECS